ncbi:MAG: DNA polymerase III subunit alpha [Treponema sp.]|nr:DNA polymerase III subunit alpha [Treponema sp.]
MTEFVHLHVHSDYSLRDAAVSVMSLADRAEELGMTHLALTDHGNMFGIMEFLAACRETVNSDGTHERRQRPIKPIIGCEVYVAPGSRFVKQGSENEKKYFHLVLLAKNREGYLNLIRLSSLAYTEGFYSRPRVDDELLSKYHGGLIALSSCASGEIPRLIQAGKIPEAEKKAVFYRDLFGKDEQGNPDFYLELQEHGIPAGELRGANLSQKEINESLAAISKKTGIPLVATNDVHYLNQDDYVAHDIMLCIGSKMRRSDENRKKRYYGDQFYFKSGDEMAALFSEYGEAIANTVRIAQRCEADVPVVADVEVKKYLPDFDIPGGFDSADSYLRHIASEGLAGRYAKETEEAGSQWEEIKKRSEYELDTITGMGFTGYFLIVADFVNWAKRRNIPVGPGRGSGAGSIVAYALGITDIDPLKYNLLFERFLNPERISMPDFDIDFANDGRDDVIEYVTSKYGKERVGQIITFGTLGAKAVIKDVARVLGISIPESEMISNLIPRDPKITLEAAAAGEPKLRELEQDPQYTELFKLARKLEGLNRHESIHAAGIVIGKRPLIDLIPLYQERDDPKTGRSGSIATQYSMNYLEPCGLVKMDLLGLKTLDVIKDTEELIRSRGKEYGNFSVKNIPEDDKSVFKMLCEGKSFEVFQFESDGMINILKQAKPGSIEDLIALNSLYRPGPMENIPRFIDSKNGKKAITYPDPRLEKVLKETYGVIVYQEQVMEVARIIAGYTMAQADLLRRAMGKKKKEILDKEKKSFLEGAAKQGYSPEKAGAIYDMLVPFAGYGFNKSHAAAYSVVAYQTAYLKANFPAEFMAANLTNEIHSQKKEKLSECIDELKKMGIAIDPPDINRSEKLFTVAGGRIVYGFLGIKGLGESTAEIIVRGRNDGPYKSFMDFLDRLDIRAVGKKMIELLVLAGAFDSLGVPRETLHGNLDRTFAYAEKMKEDRLLGQTNLFEDTSESGTAEFEFEEFPAMNPADKFNKENELLGFYISGHPMDEYREIWQKAVKVDLGNPGELKTGSCILVGMIKNIKIHTTSNGNKMAFASISDFNGEIEVTFFTKVWDKYNSNIEAGKVAILRGKIEYQKNREKRSFLADEWIPRQDADSVIREAEAQERKWAAFRDVWLHTADLKSSSLAKAEKGNYTIVGYIKSLRDFKDRNGGDMAFGTLSDYEGDIDIVFFSRVWNECRNLLKVDEVAALKGSIDPENSRNPEKPDFKVTSIADLAQLTRSAGRRAAAGMEPPGFIKGKAAEANSIIHIKLAWGAADCDETLVPLRDFITGNPGTNTVFIHIPLNGGDKIIKTASGIKSTEDFKRCFGVAEAWRE